MQHHTIAAASNLDGLTAWFASIPVPIWLGLLGIGVLIMSVTRKRRTPVIKARHLGGQRRGIGPGLWRLISGAHLDGKIRSDATWWKRGHKDLSETGRAPRWVFLPRGIRMLIRWAAGTFTVWFAIGWASDRATTVTVTVIMATLGAGIAVWHGIRRKRITDRMAAFVQPLHNALAVKVGHPATVKAHEWIGVPADFATAEDAVIRLSLPDSFVATSAMQTLITETVTNKLGIALDEFEVRFHAQGHRPFVTFTRMIPSGTGRDHLRVVTDDQPPVQRWHAQRRDVG